jgi:hypothetical protein
MVKSVVGDVDQRGKTSGLIADDWRKAKGIGTFIQSRREMAFLFVHVIFIP